MELNSNESTGHLATWSHLVAPAFAGVQGGVCPQAARMADDSVVATPATQAPIPTVAGFRRDLGVRPWSPLIT